MLANTGLTGIPGVGVGLWLLAGAEELRFVE